jgi:phosphopentomutase
MTGCRTVFSMYFRRVLCIILDGVGVGEAPDAADFGDAGSNSLGNTSRFVGSLRLPTLGRMGLGYIVPIEGVTADPSPIAFHGRMTPVSRGKDSTSGHWELMGCVLATPLPVYPKGFPVEIVTEFEQRIGRKVLGNKPASGTAIIQELGAAHIRSGRPILYTSQDSVFQLAAHESVIPPEELYRYCEIARSIMQGPHGVARIIARPFSGDIGSFYRTAGRRDFSLPPIGRTVLDALVEAGRNVLAIGKINDLFAGRGITRHVPTKNNREGMEATLNAASDPEWSFVFTNLIDFDMMWGHRNDARAYALGLEDFDSYLPGLLERLSEDVLLVIASDHGNDPTTPSTDHSREYVPLLVYHRRLERGAGVRDLGTRRTFADVGRTIADNFDLDADVPGSTFLPDIIE